MKDQDYQLETLAVRAGIERSQFQRAFRGALP